MTLLNVRNQILGLFTDRDTLTTADFAAIKLTEELEPHREAIVRTVLQDLSESGMIRDLKAPGQDLASAWVLTCALGSAGQQVGISLELAASIAEEVNAYRDANDLTEEWPETDALAINENSVLMLLDIIGDLRHEDSDEPLPGDEWKGEDDGEGAPS